MLLLNLQTLIKKFLLCTKEFSYHIWAHFQVYLEVSEIIERTKIKVSPSGIELMAY
jgi:hypothetical protein